MSMLWLEERRGRGMDIWGMPVRRKHVVPGLFWLKIYFQSLFCYADQEVESHHGLIDHGRYFVWTATPWMLQLLWLSGKMQKAVLVLPWADVLNLLDEIKKQLL